MDSSIIWLIKILLAHLLSDFLLQPASWIKSRYANGLRSQYLYYHVGVTGLAAILLVGIGFWLPVALLTVLHGAIDVIRCRFKDNFRNLLLDQAAHLVVIGVTWLVLFSENLPSVARLADFYTGSRAWAFIAGFFFLTYPSSIIIKRATETWNVSQGLKNAGKYIGMIERVLICILVYMGQFEAIGLLITGKSILRYDSTHEEKKTEYLLVGTLLSVFLAIATGMLLKTLAGA